MKKLRASPSGARSHAPRGTRVPPLCFFHWDISVIYVTIISKLTVTVFVSLYFQRFWPKWHNFFLSFQKHFDPWPKKNPEPHLRNTVPWNRFVPAHHRRPVVVCRRKSTWPTGKKRPPTSNWRWRSSWTTTPTTSHRSRGSSAPPALFCEAPSQGMGQCSNVVVLELYQSRHVWH